VAEFFIAGVERYFDRLLELETEIVRLTRETLDDKHTTLERVAVALNQSVTRFIGDKQVELTRSSNHLHRMVGQFTFKKEHRLEKMKHQLRSSVLLWFSFHENQIGKKRTAIKHAIDDSLLKQNATIMHFKDRLIAKTGRRVLKEQERIHYHENTARLIDPVNVLKRGYSITFSNGKLIKTAGQLKVNDEIETRFVAGKLKSIVTKTDNNDS
jgi:exodeoxyribonuclease VII large subunit